MQHTLYRRPLPEGTISLASPEGRTLFAEALAGGGLDGYFALAEQFHTQSDPAYCGLGSLVMALNALGIDPQRLWKGAWRWFAEDLLDCCVPLELVRERGIDLEEFACLARCNSADVELVRAEDGNDPLWRVALANAASGEQVIVASYDRRSLGQTGSGHFSPIAGYHAARDLVLILDVARFKYPPHWVPAERLWTAMQSTDPTTSQRRGWLALKAASRAPNAGNAACCARS
jgi:glutathione gamma-glutamylcysteinyltransferase